MTRMTSNLLVVVAAAAAIMLPTASVAENLFDRIGLAIIADRYGIRAQLAIDFQERSQQSAFDLAPLFSVCKHTGRSADDVWKLRRQGLGWGQIAHKLGMHPGTFNKLRKSGEFDKDAIWTSICKERYGAKDAEIRSIKKRGGSMSDVLAACHIAKESHRGPGEVFTRFEKDRDWDHVASDHKANSRINPNHGDRVDPHDHGKPNHDEMGRRQSQDEGRRNGKSAGHGGGKGKGRGHGNR